MNKKRNVYLKMKTLAEAREIILNGFNATGQWAMETIAVPDAVGRVLAEPVHARLSAPHFHAVAMDGIAVKASDTFGASEAQPKQLVTGRNAYWVNTGHVLPESTDAVIMIEHINVIDKKTLEIDSPAFPWQHIRKIGEDIVATELLFPQNHLITPYCLGALISGGVFSVTVKKKPIILIIPTGSELVDWQQMGDTALQPGQVLDANSYVLGSLAAASGATVVRHDPLMDDPAILTETVRLAAHSDADIILTVGGSSAGSEDYSKEVIETLGDILVHGVTIMPGKPVIVGNINHKPIFGIPGYPVSAIIAFEQFVEPLINQFLGQPEKIRQTVSVEPTRKIASKLGLEEFIRVKLGLCGQSRRGNALAERCRMHHQYYRSRWHHPRSQSCGGHQGQRRRFSRTSATLQRDSKHPGRGGESRQYTRCSGRSAQSRKIKSHPIIQPCRQHGRFDGRQKRCVPYGRLSPPGYGRRLL